jgi:hypothetical protein
MPNVEEQRAPGVRRFDRDLARQQQPDVVLREHHGGDRVIDVWLVLLDPRQADAKHAGRDRHSSDALDSGAIQKRTP